MKVKKTLCTVIAALFTIFTMLSYIPAAKVKAAIIVPKIQFATAPVTQYKVGERVNFNINAPNYGGRVEYRVVLWEDSKKTYHDLWSASNGHPTRYYTKWQPYGNEIFTLGWIINEPGSYRITVYAKRLGVANNKTYLKGYNCDSYMESVAFKVVADSNISYIMASTDVVVNQGQVPSLPSTVKAIMTDGTEKSMSVTWGSVNTSQAGAYTIQGTVQGTDKKAIVRVIVNPTTTPTAGLNVYSINAVSATWVNVNLKDTISTIPSSSVFTIKNSSNAVVRIVTTSLSTDKKTIQIYTDFMTPGATYTLSINGVSYNFIVPYTGSSTGSISISVDDMVVAIDDEVDPDITVYPSNATLRFSSEDDDIAEVNSSTGEVTGIEEGTVTIYVYAYSSTYGTAYTTFEVEVVEDYDNLPDEDYCDADHEFDDYDEVYTITLYIMDSDDDPVENLDEDDFKFSISGKTYDFDDDDVLYDFDDYDEEDGIYVFEFNPDELPRNEQESDNEYELDVFVNNREIISSYDLTEDGESGGHSGDVDNDESWAKSIDDKTGTATITACVRDEDGDGIENLSRYDFEISIDNSTKRYIVEASKSPFRDFDELSNGKYVFTYDPSYNDDDMDIKIDVYVDDVKIENDLSVKVTNGTKVTGITVKAAEDATEVVKGETLQMTAVVTPSTVTNNDVEWSVKSGTGVAAISLEGLLTGVTGGTVTVTATALDGSGVKGTKIITVIAPVQSVTVKTTGDAVEVENGKTLQFTAEVLPTDATSKSVTWSVVSGGATINSNGLLTATSEGTVIVKAVSNSDNTKYGEKTITVIEPIVLVSSIKILPEGDISVVAGQTYQFTVEVLPDGASNKGVEWDRINGSGRGYITIDGLFTAETAGTVTITVEAKDGSGISTEKEITITPAPAP